MVKLPAARRHRRSRIGYALGLLVFLGVATALALVVRNPAFSATQQLAEPVPAPEITVAEREAGSATEPEPDEPGGVAAEAPPTSGTAGVGAGEGSLADRAGDPVEPGRSLFYTGLLGLAISLAGLGLVGTRRRQW
ncbi:hypothetical protein O7598_29580 [Micromonospora sp. WMMC241]|uniref:hypothetical protein n=1 Tax=Micromonospora sp. WMMC241 TaxID=3015159 RepID=UPI0022B648D1|nr:hypothetical protein [Micromonospora sp. WMMC241]MCZ7440575.1 hypothetical protein [Micromonospora sp. WMMC241]